MRVQHLIALLLVTVGPAYGLLFWFYDLTTPALIMILVPAAALPALFLLTRRGSSEEGGRVMSIIAFLSHYRWV